MQVPTLRVQNGFVAVSIIKFHFTSAACLETNCNNAVPPATAVVVLHRNTPGTNAGLHVIKLLLHVVQWAIFVVCNAHNIGLSQVTELSKQTTRYSCLTTFGIRTWTPVTYLETPYLS